MITTVSIVTDPGVTQSLLLFLLLLTDEMMDVRVKNEYDSFMKFSEGSITDKTTDEFIRFIADDKFRSGTFLLGGNATYLATLKKLKESFVRFYFKNLDDIRKEYTDITRVNNVYDRIGKYIIQIMRLRHVIEPEVQISKNVHPRTGHHYLAIKAYWIDDNGKKVRKFTKSIGRAENYPQGIEDKKALSDGIKLIQPVLFENYQEIYKD